MLLSREGLKPTGATESSCRSSEEPDGAETLLQLNLMSGAGATSGAARSAKGRRQLSVKKGTSQPRQNLID